jgi:CzcA family heavy metal efflux pump
MLDAIIRYSLNHRLAILALMLSVCAYGAFILEKLPVDVLPNLNRPTVTILTESHGLAPEEVEALVTLPIESVLNGSPGVLRLRSTSGIGISIIYVEFDWGTDILKNRQVIAERLQLLQGRLPEGIVPSMGPITSIMGEIQFVGLVAKDPSVTPMDLRSYADWTLRPQLLTIPGLSQVVVMGGDVKQFQILVSSKDLLAKGISLEQLKNAISEISENTTGGFIDIGDKEFLIRPLGRVEGIDDIKNSAIGTHLGNPVFIKDVAEVKIAAKTKRGEGSINGKPSVILTLQKQPDASTVELTKLIDAKIATIEPVLPHGMALEKNLFKQAHFIRTAISNVKEALRDGIVMVAIILFLFLLNVRTTMITLIAIPISLLVTAIVFHFMGLSVNTMTLGGLAVAIGELVDDAIVDVENVFRRLRENRASPNPISPLKVVYQGSSEVRNSIVISTAIVCLVFIPLFALDGIEGRLFMPLGIAYVISILASLAVSLTITPVLCFIFLPNSKAIGRHDEGFFVRFIKKITSSIIRFSIPKPWLVFSLCLALLAAAVSLLPRMGRNFLPNFNEGSATIGVAAAPGISLAASNILGTKVEEAILSVDEVVSTVRRTGRAEMDEHAEGVHWNEIDVDFKEGGRPRPIVLKEIRERIEAAGDVYVNIGQPISHRLDHLLSGVRAQIAIKVFGPELSDLRRVAGEIQSLMENIPGIVDLQTEPQVLIPQLKIAIDREEAGKRAITVGTLAEDLELALNGEALTQQISGLRTHDIFMRLDDSSRATDENIGRTFIKTLNSGQKVLLGDVAQVYQGTGPNMINREDMQRRIVISANTENRDLNSVVRDIQSKLKEGLTLPEGFYIKIGGQFESEQAASKRIVLLGSLSLIGIFVLLYLHFRSSVLSLQVMLNIPLALIGSVFAIYMTERILSVATLIAFITLCGVASRNGILMISHYLHLMTEEGEVFGMEMIVRGTLERLVPVLMTASTAALALIPLLLAAGEPGKEILHPVAVVIVGGLISSTLLDLIVTPTAFYLFGRKAAEQYIRHKANQGEVL